MPVLNLSNVKQMDFKPIPAGRYILKVVEAEERMSKQEKPYLNLQLAVSEDDDEFANRRVFTALTYDEGKAFMLVQFLKAIGYTDEELSEVTLDEEFMTEIEGVEVGAQVAIEKQEGYDDKNIVKRFFAVAAAEPTLPSDSETF